MNFFVFRFILNFKNHHFLNFIFSHTLLHSVYGTYILDKGDKGNRITIYIKLYTPVLCYI